VTQALATPNLDARFACGSDTIAAVGFRSEDWAAILNRLLEGDRAAFVKMSQLVTGFLVAWRAYDFRDEWDDVIQEVILAVVEAARANRLRKPAAIPGYVRTATHYKFVDWIRRTKREPLESEPFQEPAVSHWPPPENTDETGFEVRDAVGTLPEKQQRAVVAVYVEGKTYDEAARDTGIPLGSLKRYLRDGLAALHAQLSEPHAGI